MVVRMNFTAGPDAQWRFIEAAVAEAGKEHLGPVAAGPVEHLLWKHGREFIAAVEAAHAASPKWRTLLAGVWRHLTEDDVWARVERLRGGDPGGVGQG